MLSRSMRPIRRKATLPVDDRSGPAPMHARPYLKTIQARDGDCGALSCGAPAYTDVWPIRRTNKRAMNVPPP